MDLYSRKIIAWTLSRTLEVEEVLKCIEMARKRRKTADPVIIHSDRGVHYTSKLYKKLTEGLILSYSKKGTPWDNANKIEIRSGIFICKLFIDFLKIR